MSEYCSRRRFDSNPNFVKFVKLGDSKLSPHGAIALCNTLPIPLANRIVRVAIRSHAMFKGGYYNKSI